MLAVCSDAKATKRSAAVNEDISAVDIALPATTNLAVLQERWSAAVEADAMTVVFSTYQSLDVVSKAQAAGGLAPFDLIVCDEAHRTTGLTLAGEDTSMCKSARRCRRSGHQAPVHDRDPTDLR